MKTSKLAKETSALLNKMAPRPSSPTSSSTISQQPSQTRRTTRSSLARFAYTSTSSASATESKTTAAATATEAALHDLVLGVADIEDVVPNPRSRKRRRVAKTEEQDGHSTPDAAVATAAAATTSPARIKIDHVETETTSTIHQTQSPPKPRKARKPARVIRGNGTSPSLESPHIEPPSDWLEIYDAVKKMRLHGAARDAAVDTMGCERLFHPDASERDRRFHILIALMLSSQTKDTVNAVAMKRLMTELPPHEPSAPAGLNLENILAVEPVLLNELIWAVGFHNNKTKFIKAAAIILRDKFDSDIPDTIEGLTSLPGVGPKMAYLCLSAAWDRTEGIGVDVHVHRITNLWGWHKTTQPEATRHALQSWLPKDKWREINWLLVGFGQTVCLPVGRKCGNCELGLGGLCKAAERKKVNEGRKARQVKVEVKEEEEAREVVIKAEEVINEEQVIRDVVVNQGMGEPVPADDEPNVVANTDAPRRSRRGGSSR
ncbi:HhH-GPD superfamily base excision DNA repair protein [Colletotrichum orchidophilum]|uniref:Endonuclease III homolog n=1 Tax=Colletotrichum orchidophilum TaxID=1209926 RepID=A0A1G4AQC7_9PEZI|nr:HhH-GPD superfamily base excision DNA repair protein [Colletotrichum orchidophilum]OHE91377.1 HhH-GPD superfamily base excision DNA repair protein [Colletotrichum orchidophilum]